jgi:hypothetical protein
VTGIFHMKPLLIGMLFASPLVIYRVGMQEGSEVGRSVAPSAPASPAAGSVLTIPVEVIATGSEPRWIDVRVGP